MWLKRRYEYQSWSFSLYTETNGLTHRSDHDSSSVVGQIDQFSFKEAENGQKTQFYNRDSSEPLLMMSDVSDSMFNLFVTVIVYTGEY